MAATRDPGPAPRHADPGAERRARTEAERILADFPARGERRSSGLPAELILSLTSYPPRYPTLALTLKSLLEQSIRPDRTILWIAESDPMPPADVMRLVDHGLEIRSCPDLRSYKKLLPALAGFPDAFIATADDDVYYQPGWLETLVSRYDVAAPAIVCHRAHVVAFDDDGHARPYLTWELETAALDVEGPGRALFPTGVGGVLYPAPLLPAAFVDAQAIAELCPHADDIWFFAMAHLAGVPRVRVAPKFQAVTWRGSQDDGLLHLNVAGGANDAQLRAIEARYGSLDGRTSASVDGRRLAGRSI